MKGEIVYAGHFKLPDRDAAAVRVSAVSDALRVAGYTVTLLGDDYTGPAASDRSRPLRRRLMTAVSRALSVHLTGRDIFKRLEHVDWSNVAAVICYPGSAILVWRLIRLCHRQRVRLIIDCTEWYDPAHVLLGRFGPLALDSALRMRLLHKWAGNVMCISSWLARHYSKAGCRVLRVPPLVGASGFRRHADLPVRNACNENGLVLVYAGFPGRKELFPEIIAGVQAARRDGIDVVLQLVGINYADLCRILRRDRGLLPEAGVVVCHGKVKREAALEFVQASDFTILLRPQKRYANAGFPSKVVESLSLGVPVMTNVTSDLGEYLRDGRDGFLLRGPTAEAVNEAIHRAARMTPDQGSAMRDDARLRAQQCFSFRNFAGVLADFIASARLC